MAARTPGTRMRRSNLVEVIEMTVAPTPLRVRPEPAPVVRDHRAHVSQWLWLGGGALFAFLVPFLFADVIAVPRDLYYAIYSLSVFALSPAWIRASGLDVHEFFAPQLEV